MIISIDKVSKTSGHSYMQWALTMLTNMTLMNYGFQVGWISPMAKVLQSPGSPTGVPLTDYEISWIASVVCTAGMVGVPLSSWLADRHGRKAGVLMIVLLQTICWLVKIFARSTTALIISRIFAGLPAGACYNIVPMYIREISDDRIRGKLGSVFILFQNTGIGLMFVMGAYLEYYQVLWICTSISIATLLFLVVIPETPAFLVKREKFELAALTLSRLRGLETDDKLIRSELESLQTSQSAFNSLPKIAFVNIFKNNVWRRGYFIIIMLVMTQSASGNFAILSYTSRIMTSAGVTSHLELQSASLPLVMTFGSFISMACVERYGRKILLGATYLVATVSLSIIGVSILLRQQGWAVPPWLPVVAMAMYACGYAAGISGLPYVVMSEMFNFQIRARIMGCLVTQAWVVSFTQLSTFTPISKTLGFHWMFFIYAIINILGAFVAIAFLPETRGKTVDEIEQELRGKNK